MAFTLVASGVDIDENQALCTSSKQKIYEEKSVRVYKTETYCKAATICAVLKLRRVIPKLRYY